MRNKFPVCQYPNHLINSNRNQTRIKFSAHNPRSNFSNPDNWSNNSLPSSVSNEYPKDPYRTSDIGRKWENLKGSAFAFLAIRTPPSYPRPHLLIRSVPPLWESELNIV
ncbi:hypothetical protein CEXT_225451 [Caerostris extrusa]|uniref:Uncharacterized protein n=1 Tax=Caerostris extrusa TaxID=172846 RepID=A0AAV4PN78_CAEEX|nr:hypothetical protein CEXT_225451 [Caerostris extrusa]